MQLIDRTCILTCALRMDPSFLTVVVNVNNLTIALARLEHVDGSIYTRQRESE